MALKYSQAKAAAETANYNSDGSEIVSFAGSGGEAFASSTTDLLTAGVWPYGQYGNYISSTGEGNYQFPLGTGPELPTEVPINDRYPMLPFLLPRTGGEIEEINILTRNNGSSTAAIVKFAIYDADTLQRIGASYERTIVAGTDEYILINMAQQPIPVNRACYLIVGFNNSAGVFTNIAERDMTYFPGWPGAVDPIDVPSLYSTVQVNPAEDLPLAIPPQGDTSLAGLKKLPFMVFRWRPADQKLTPDPIGGVASESVSVGGVYQNAGTFPATQKKSSWTGTGATFNATVVGNNVTSVVSTNAGSGYIAGESIVLDIPGAVLLAAECVITVDSIA